MKTCPHCLKEIEELNFTCPYCHQRVPMNIQGKGYAKLGDYEAYKERALISIEDKAMIRDKNHAKDGDDDLDCAQPYSYVTRENGDRN